MAGPVPKMSKEQIIKSLVEEYKAEVLKRPPAQQPQALDNLLTRAEAVFKAQKITITRDEIREAILGRSIGPVVPKVADAVNDVYSKFATTYTAEFAAMKTLTTDAFEARLKPLVDKAEEAFKKAQKADPELKIPTRKEIEQELLVRGEMKDWLANRVLPSCKRLEKLLSNEHLTVAQYDAGLKALHEGKSIDQLWVALRKVGVGEAVISRVQTRLAENANDALNITIALDRDLYHFESAPDRTVRGTLTRAGAAIWACQVPVAKLGSLLMAGAAVGPVKLYDAIRKTDVWDNRAKPWLDEFGNKRGWLATPKLLVVLAIGGVGFGAYKIWGPESEEARVEADGTAVKPVVLRDEAVGIPDILTEPSGGARRSIMQGTEGKARAAKIAKKVGEVFKNDVAAQQRCLTIVADMVNGDPAFKASSQKFIKKLEDVEQFVAALAELQKSKLTVDTARLATAMFTIIKYYKLDAYADVARDLVLYLGKKPGADVEKVLSDPEEMLRAIGQPITKYSKEMTPEWLKRPFPAFRDAGFNEKEPYVQSASAMIRQYFNKDDWNEVAEAMAAAYAEQRFEQNPRDVAPTAVPQKCTMHLQALSMLMYGTSEPVLDKESRSKGMELKTAIKTLALLAQKFKQEKQYMGDEEARKENIWNLAAKEIGIYDPSYSGSDEATNSVLAMHPEWLRPGVGKELAETSPISTMIAKKITEKYPDYSKKQLGLSRAINDLFTDEYRQRAAEGVLAMVDPTMTVSEIQEAAHKLAFEAKPGQRGMLFKTFMDVDLAEFFPAEGEDAKNAAKFKADTARSLHTLTTYEEYKAARDALEMFILKFGSDLEAGYGKVGYHIEPSPEIIKMAADAIVKAVRGQETVDIGKVSDAVLNSKEKPYVEARDKMLGREKKR